MLVPQWEWFELPDNRALGGPELVARYVAYADAGSYPPRAPRTLELRTAGEDSRQPFRFEVSLGLQSLLLASASVT